MCTSRPNIPPPPPPPQEVKQPDNAQLMDRTRRRQGGMVTGTMLTGPSGVNTSGMSTGRVSLLGQ